MLKVLLLAALVVVSPLLGVQESNRPETKLATGVKLTYKVTWMGIRAGTGIIFIGNITKKDDNYVIPVTSCVSTTGFARVFVKVDDCLWSWLDPVKLTPYRFEERIREASYSRDRIIEFNRQENIGRIFRPENGKVVLEKEVPIEENFHDLLSWTFFLSTQKLEIGQVFTFKVLTYQNVDNTILKVKDIKWISLSRLGKFQAYQLVPAGETRKSIKKRGGAGDVWVDSGKRLPLVISLKIPGAGSLKLTLIKIE